MTIRRMMVLLCLGICLLASPGRSGEVVTWTLKGYGRFGSASGAATFTPAHTPGAAASALTQGVDPIQWVGDGTLRIPGGMVVLSRPGPDGEPLTYELPGPSLWYLRGVVPSLLSGYGGEYHDKSKGSGIMGTPALIAGAEGTRYELEVGTNGSTLVVVSRGIVTLKWRNPSRREELKVQEGQAAIAFMGGTRAGSLVLYEGKREARKVWKESSGGTRGIPGVTSETEELLAIRQMLARGEAVVALEEVQTRAGQNSSASYLPAALFETWQVATLQGDVATADVAARALRRIAPRGEFTQLQQSLAQSAAGVP